MIPPNGLETIVWSVPVTRPSFWSWGNSKLVSQNKTLEVNVCGIIVKETSGEHLLGLTVQNDMSWFAHLYGNNLKGEQKKVSLLELFWIYLTFLLVSQ